MKKLLTISVAAYNVEKYIEKTIESLIDVDIIDYLEIFIIDDGGNDNTLQIAQKYAEQYPQSIFCVHKENGGYGSTLNYSIPRATGKYFKVLDGDDWFDKDGLKEFVTALNNIDADIIVTPYLKCFEDGTTQKVNVINGYKLNTKESIKNLCTFTSFGMWTVAFKSDVLKNCKLSLPEHCFYTDRIYCTVPFAYAKTIYFMNTILYCYRIGRDEQTISKTSRINYREDNILVNNILYNFYETQKSLNNENLDYILPKVAIAPREVFEAYLLEPASDETLHDLADYDRSIKAISPDVYYLCGKVSFQKKMALYIQILRHSRYNKIVYYIGKLFYK